MTIKNKKYGNRIGQKLAESFELNFQLAHVVDSWTIILTPRTSTTRLKSIEISPYSSGVLDINIFVDGIGRNIEIPTDNYELSDNNINLIGRLILKTLFI
jgi:hypothetical protein